MHLIHIYTKYIVSLTFKCDVWYLLHAEKGFCNSESLNGGTRGVFRWNEAEVNSNVSTTCFYGPPEVRVTRFCVSRNNLTAPSIEDCRTVISDRYISLNNVRLP